MDIWNCFYSIESIKNVVSSAEAFRECVVGGIVLVLQLKLLGLATAVVHVVCAIDGRAYFDSVFGVFVTVATLDMELSFLLIFLVFGVRVDAFALQFLLDDLAFDESFRFLKIIHGAYDLWVSGDDVCANVSKFRSDAVLDPDWAVLIVGSLVKVVSSTGRKHACLSIIHYLNNN